MKKVFLLLVLAILFANFSFGESRETKIANSIEQARYVNFIMSGIKDPNKIQPGQIIFVPIPVKKGDNEWLIFDKVLPWNFPDTTFYKDSIPATPKAINGSNDQPNQKGIMEFIQKLPWWAWGLLLLFVFGLISAILQNESEKKRNVDPITAGDPQVPGGVDDQNAYGRMAGLAKSRFPSATLAIRNIRRGHLSGLGEIFYADGKSKNINLKDVPAYAGEILVNGKEQTIYFLQGCGNDARSGNFMSGKEFTFNPDVLINEDGSESPLPQEQVENFVTADQIQAAKKSLEEKSEVVELAKTEVSGSEKFRIQMRMMDIGEKAAEKGNLHSLIFDLKSDGSLKTAVNFKAPELHPEKKNEKTGTEGKDN